MNSKPKIALLGLSAIVGAAIVSRSQSRAEETPSKPAPKIIQVASKEAMNPAQFDEYRAAIEKTAAMSRDDEAQKLAQKHGLQILDLTWEDTGRYKGSSVGPNISDMTIQVAARDPQTEAFSVSCMPVIRFPNFEDKTTDLDPRDFTLLVGNQAHRNLRRVSLWDVLNKPTAFLSRPWTWKAPRKSLVAPRDSKVLVSAQACFLPIPRSGKATFNPVLFNYQSSRGAPAVLTILATREGTSMTVIDNTRDAFESGSAWGQRLFHNQNGQSASLTGTRESEFLSDNPSAGTKTPQVGKESGLNMVLLVQVPLKFKEVPRANYGPASMAMDAAGPMLKSETRRSDVENAVIGHGALEGPFTEIDNLTIERDPKFPVRVTVQFYKATSNGVVSEADLHEIKAQIDRVFARGDYVGSLVTQGETGRVTEYEGVKVQPEAWWEQFWKRHQQNTGDSREEAIAKLRRLMGRSFEKQPVSELYLRNLLRER